MFIDMKFRVCLILMSLLSSISCIKDKELGNDLKVGDSLPDFSVQMNNGDIITDDSLKGNVSVILFFHTSCPDCQRVLPEFQRIYDEYIDKDVKFAIISREESEDEIYSYWNENGLEMPYSAQKTRDVYSLFAASRIPRVYISDKGGIIRYIYTDDPTPGYDEMKSSLESVIR